MCFYMYVVYAKKSFVSFKAASSYWNISLMNFWSQEPMGPMGPGTSPITPMKEVVVSTSHFVGRSQMKKY